MDRKQSEQLGLQRINQLLLANKQMRNKWQMLKEQCIQQSLKFTNWDRNKMYSTFHSSHYDWWAFPVDKPSSYGQKYQVFPEDKEQLIKDKHFITALRTNAILVSRSWGYDLQNGKYISTESKEQRWQKWPIRLYKMSSSLELFEQRDLHRNSIKYGLWLISKGENFTYTGRHLDEYYRMWQNTGRESLKEQKKEHNYEKQMKKQENYKKGYEKVQRPMSSKKKVETKPNQTYSYQQRQLSQVRKEGKPQEIQTSKYKSVAKYQNNERLMPKNQNSLYLYPPQLPRRHEIPKFQNYLYENYLYGYKS